jgi:putative ABC transport system permease protein
MTFVVRMALREIRSSWQRLLFFFICIAIGVAAIIALRSVIQSVRAGMSQEAQALVAADILLTSNSDFTPKVLDTLRTEQRAGHVTATSQAIELPTMVRPADASKLVTRMVELRAVQQEFPFYGTLTLADGTYSHDMLLNHGAIVRPELLAQLGLKVGDSIIIGNVPFQIRGIIGSEPGRSLGAFSLGPRVIIDYTALSDTGLLSFGSRASHQLLMKVPAPALDPLTDSLRSAFANEFVGVRSYRRNDDQMGENLTRAENYLSLVGLVVLILGGIGVSSVTRVFVQQKLRSIAILKCIGASSREIFAVYMTQVLLLGIAGSILGVGIAAAVIAAVPSFVGNLAATLNVQYGLTAAAVIQGLAIGLLVSVLFSLVPLLDVRHVKPSLLLRHDMPPLARIDWIKWGVTAIVAGSLVGVAAWQAGSLRVGLMLSAGFVATAFVLHLAGLALVRAVQPLRYSPSFALRQAVLHIARPGNQTRVILLAVGLGTFFILGVRTLQANLLQDFAVQVGDDAPDMFLIDIQQDQKDGLASFLDQQNGAERPPNVMPTLRARITAVRGREVNLETYEQVRGRGSLSREYTVTYRPQLNANEEILQGAWWPSTPAAGEAEVSIEESLQKRFRINIGDEMQFDVLGRRIPATVTSIRKVNWRDYRSGGFMLVFRPGVLDNAPHSYIASVNGPRETTARARMQAQLVARYPNVSVIDLREVLDTIQTIVNGVTLGVSVVGGLVLLSGLLILVGAVSMTKFQRVYEAAILKTLGASSRLIAAMLLLEYGVLGAIAGTIGALGAIALSWAVATYALELDTWHTWPSITVGGIVATAIGVATIGVLASWDVLRHKPLATLRAE